MRNRFTEIRTDAGVPRDKAGSCRGFRVFGAIYDAREDVDESGDEKVPK
jgi:hypothetical protein